MVWLVLVCVVIVIIGVALKAVEAKKAEQRKGSSGGASSTSGPLRTESRPSVLTDRELVYYKNLLPIIPTSMVLLCKVRMEDVLKVKGKDRQDINRQRNRIKSRHFDFVLCDADTLTPYCAIELDDRSHVTESQKKGDATKDEACESAEFFLFRVQKVTDTKPVKDLLREIATIK